MTANRASTPPRYFPTPAERLLQAPVSSIEPMPSPSMYDELLHPLWWTSDGVQIARPDARVGVA